MNLNMIKSAKSPWAIQEPKLPTKLTSIEEQEQQLEEIQGLSMTNPIPLLDHKRSGKSKMLQHMLEIKYMALNVPHR
jgi:hypothetical protein